MYNKAFTHGGKFHADDVFSAALLRILNPAIQIERGFQVPEDYDGVVFDIGGGEFDHHQADARIRENGVKYAAFGLLWERYGAELIGEEEAKRFDEHFIQPLDQSDNTGSKHMLAEMISRFNPGWNEERDTDEGFLEALDVAEKVLRRYLSSAKGMTLAKQLMENAVKTAENHILILDRFIPWKDQVCKVPDIYYVIFPSMRGGYNAQAVPISEETIELRIPFPEAWRGKAKEELVELTGIPDIEFCHASGFLISAGTLDSIKKACELSMKSRI